MSASGFRKSIQLRACAWMILLDIRMTGLSGPQLQNTLAHHGSWLPVIFVTAHPEEDIRSQAIAQGAFAFLYKPVDGEEFLATVNAAVKWNRDKSIGKLRE